MRELLPDAVLRLVGRDRPSARTSSRVSARRSRRARLEPRRILASTPLPKKLGIKEGSVVCLVGAPEGFELEGLPAGAVVRRRGSRDLTMVWVRSAAEAERVWDRLAVDEKVDDVWVVWAKKASPLYSGVTQANVREPGMARGFVDFKVCAIDENWTGLRFKRRR